MNTKSQDKTVKRITELWQLLFIVSEKSFAKNMNLKALANLDRPEVNIKPYLNPSIRRKR